MVDLRTLLLLVAVADVMVAVVLWGWRRLRAAQRRARLQIVREERERLARELHDTLIQGCTGVSVLLEAIASARDANNQVVAIGLRPLAWTSTNASVATVSAAGVITATGIGANVFKYPFPVDYQCR